MPPLLNVYQIVIWIHMVKNSTKKLYGETVRLSNGHKYEFKWNNLDFRIPSDIKRKTQYGVL